MRLRADTPAHRAEEMANLCITTARQLMTALLLLYLQGVRGDLITVFSGEGGAATLPCNNVVQSPRCLSTTWAYSWNGEAAVEVVSLGKVNSGITYRVKRPSLLPNCSLHITDVSTEDVGLYTCQHYVEGNKSTEDTSVYVSVLNIASRITESRQRSNVTLHCHLHTHRDLQRSVYNTDKHLHWVDEQGLGLQNTNNLHISHEARWSTTLELRDLNIFLSQRTWRCQLTAGGHVQTSATYTTDVPVKLPRSPSSPVTRRPAPPTAPESASPQPPPLTTATSPLPLTTTAPVCAWVFSVENPIRLSIFSFVLIVPGLIGILHLVKRREQTCRGTPSH